jgi:uncharacterized protein (DUF2126 family)/transglutaminase-like putative cysteine protease
MSMPMKARVAVTHTLEERFEHPVRLSTHWLRLRPAPQTRARVTAYSLALHAGPHFLNWVRDPFENYLARLDLPEPVKSLGIELEFIAELTPVIPFDFLTEPDAARYPFGYPAHLRKELAPYLRTPAPGPRLSAWLARLDRSAASTVERLDAVNRHVQSAHLLSPAVLPGPVDPEDVLQRREVSSWELAWLLTLSLRHLGLAARFVCGYRIVLVQASPAQDSVNLHAWSEAYLPGAGWIGLDPAAGLFTTESYIPLACAPDPLRVLPIVGYREACEETRVERIRVSRLAPVEQSWPYTEAQWADLRALGCHLERDLARRGLTPTLGTSLSLVSACDAEAPEWNTVAVGPSKRRAAEELLQRLWARLAPGGAPQLGQGEWYAGDALPRWRLGCFFRADGRPLWRNPERLGWGRAGDDISLDDARRFTEALARALGVRAVNVIAAHEDALYELSCMRTPFEYVPSAEELDDPARRRALAECLSLCRGEPVGYVLPVRWDHRAGRWSSGAWSFRRDGLYLMPGSSPLGYRLPLDSLVSNEDASIEAQAERCQFEERPLLPEIYGEVGARLSSMGAPRPGVEAADEGPNGDRPPRTALCVEVRRGRLSVFLPPVSHLEHYLELVAGVEAAAEAIDIHVLLEGYEPPEDYRLRRFVLEPDAGVLRLTLPETERWEERLGLLEAGYQEAARAGLRAERVMPDRRRLPSGGGSRLTLGGTRPADSPFLRRPEILRALITYWQRHPSLSYFFAGRTIGPSGAAPRPDEGRDEALYELSIALQRLPRGENSAPWVTDRVLRHLLADPSGDLKRAEIRVDQLYAPERASLRLGRILVSAFETAPEERIAALQSLLVLGLLGRCARHPDSGGLLRWGPALHDRFMLPGVLWQDLRGVIEDLNAVGYPFQLEWFEPLMVLRFPVLGKVQLGEITLELQAAHEPWPLLAEELAGGRVARFVDVANERVQVRLSGLPPGRYVLVCNGCRVPLQGTGVHGEYLAGVRYKVSNPPATLHPTIPPVEALVFDLFDTWSGLAVGGCSYFPPRPEVAGPVGSPLATPSGGEQSPRERPPTPPLSVPPRSRGGHFLPQGSRRGPMSPPPAAPDERYPYLLDLTQVVHAVAR